MIQKIIPSVAEALRDIADGSTIFISGFGGAGFLRAYECDIVRGNWHMSSVNHKNKL